IRWHTGGVRLPAALVAAAALAVGIGAAPAQASEGSVPVEVADYVAAPDGLLAALDDFYGVGENGTGLDFDETTTTGQIDRVFAFAPAWLAGQQVDPPVELTNEWTVPVSIGDEPVGLAILWINPATVEPELADFVPDRDVAAALAAVADGTFVVHDAPRSAWFLLAPPDLTPVVSGTSGISGPSTLSVYQGLLAGPTPAAVDRGPSFASVLSVGTIVGVALIVILVLLLPLATRRRRAPDDPPEPDEG
ncbi:MAG: hypothetical protein PSU94_07205, partial [Lacunisphaera sp.]|nr:hypothetical protein [Lacunisphaera sp.]